jgi:hypothetical protein
MKSRHISTLVMVGMALTTAAMAAKSAPTRKAPQSDLASIESRRATVDLAISLAKQETPEALPDSLPLPFNPAGFNRVVREEVRASDAGPATPAKAYGDHEILTAIAVRVTPTGTFDLGGTRWLQFSKKRLKVGDKLTVTHEGQDYTLVLSAIDATNFTLRLNREEITRPIKPGKNP